MSGLTDSAAQAAILVACRTLGLPSIAAEAERLAQQAERERHSYLAYLANALGVEVDDRTTRRITRRIGEDLGFAAVFAGPFVRSSYMADVVASAAAHA